MLITLKLVVNTLPLTFRRRNGWPEVIHFFFDSHLFRHKKLVARVDIGCRSDLTIFSFLVLNSGQLIPTSLSPGNEMRSKVNLIVDDAHLWI